MRCIRFAENMLRCHNGDEVCDGLTTCGNTGPGARGPVTYNAGIGAKAFLSVPSYLGSRSKGMVMHRGPPRPRTNSEPLIAMHVTPWASRAAEVRSLRS